MSACNARVAVLPERTRRRLRLEKQIEEMWDEDLRSSEIARELGVHQDHVSRVLKGIKRKRAEAAALAAEKSAQEEASDAAE